MWRWNVITILYGLGVREQTTGRSGSPRNDQLLVLANADVGEAARKGFLWWAPPPPLSVDTPAQSEQTPNDKVWLQTVKN